MTTEIEHYDGTPHISLFDVDNPRSLINITWPEFSKYLKAAYAAHREWFLDDERTLERKIEKSQAPLTVLMRVRLNFWDEYNQAQTRGGSMKLTNVLRGVCSYGHWIHYVIENPMHLAYIVLPPADYVSATKQMHHKALNEMGEILDLPTREDYFDSRGVQQTRVNTRLISEKVKIFQVLDERVKGAIVQKLAVQTRQDISVTSTSNPLSHLPLNDLKAIERQIAEVNHRIKAAELGHPPNLLPLSQTPQMESSDIIEVGGNEGAEETES